MEEETFYVIKQLRRSDRCLPDSLQEKQHCSDLVSARACVCAPNSGGGVNSWQSHADF